MLQTRSFLCLAALPQDVQDQERAARARCPLSQSAREQGPTADHILAGTQQSVKRTLISPCFISQCLPA